MSQGIPNKQDQEINLSEISDKIAQIYDRFLAWIFTGIIFVKKNLVLFLVLLVSGIAIGLYLDRTSVSYNNEIILSPNFGSTDYAYAKVNLVNSKIIEGDTIFLKSIGISKPKLFSKVSILPITDIYNFINNDNKNFELIKLMAEDGDINAIIEDETTSKNYSHHLLQIKAKKVIERSDIDALLNYLNTSDYYSKIQTTAQTSIKRRIEESEKTLKTIDSILSNFAKSSNSLPKNDKLIYYNENSQLNEVFGTRSNLITEIANKKVELLVTDKVIKEISSVLNVKNTKSLDGKFKLIVPLLFIFIFLSIHLFIVFYRKQSALYKQNLK